LAVPEKVIGTPATSELELPGLEMLTLGAVFELPPPVGGYRC